MNRPTKWQYYKWVIVLSAAGFLGTGILVYPYGIFWDNAIVLQNLYLNKPPTDWMGWFYPMIWKFLWKITNLPHAIGLLHNMLYWVSIPIIYINLFPKCKFYAFWYLIFAFCPPALIFLINITNNVLLLAFLLIAVAMGLCWLRYKKTPFYIGAALFLLCAAWVRRDAVFLCVPIIGFLSIFLFPCFKNGFFLLPVAAFLAAFFLTTYSVKRNYPSYASMHSLELIMLFDLVGMSYLEQEVLLPDEIFKPEYRGENKKEILKKINGGISIYNDFTAANTFGTELLYTPDIYAMKSNGLSFKNAFPYYWSHLPSYLWFRVNVLYHYAFLHSFYNQRFNYSTEYPEFFYQNLDRSLTQEPLVPWIDRWRHIGVKILYRVAPFFFQLWFYLALSFISFYFLLTGKCENLKESTIGFMKILLVSSWIFIAVNLLAAVSIQFRYLMPANMIIWFVFIYVVQSPVTSYFSKNPPSQEEDL